MIKKKIIVFLIIVLIMYSCSDNQKNQGLLMLVGGKKKPAEALTTFIEYCKGGKILIIPSASALPLESGPEAAELFRSHGAQKVDWIFIQDSTMASADSVIKQVRNAAGIFFTGGVQTRLMNRIGGTPVEAAVKKLYFEKGGVIGGTSAGAAVMSEMMITGEGDFTVLNKNNIVTEKGLGLLDNCIIDQHFVKRKRNNRLLSLVIEHTIPGIGIDESTAVLYYPDNTFKVVGEGSVIIYSTQGSKIRSVSNTGKIGIENLKLSVLYNRQWFDLDKNKIISK